MNQEDFEKELIENQDEIWKEQDRTLEEEKKKLIAKFEELQKLMDF